MSHFVPNWLWKYIVKIYYYNNLYLFKENILKKKTPSKNEYFFKSHFYYYATKVTPDKLINSSFYSWQHWQLACKRGGAIPLERSRKQSNTKGKSELLQDRFLGDIWRNILLHLATYSSTRWLPTLGAPESPSICTHEWR